MEADNFRDAYYYFIEFESQKGKFLSLKETPGWILPWYSLMS
jgi:hypothetical protein